MQMRTKKNKLLKRGRAVALAAVLFCTLILGTMALAPPIRAEAASINGLPINQKLQTINASSRYGNGIKYIVVHYTGAPGSAANNATYFSTGYRGASAHYFVGYSGEVWQSVSDSLAAWSVGGNKYPGTAGGSVYGKCTNYNSINIEMCVRTSGSRSDTSKDWYFENATINSTVKLVQELMKKYNVPLSRVVRHYDVVGKYCPNPFVLNDDPVTWSSFKSMVAGDKDLPPDTGSSSTSGKPSAPSTGGAVSASGINVRYQAYVNGQWLPWVTNYNNVSSDGYAGIPCRAVTGLRAYTVGSQSAVGNLQYRVHLRGGQWLPWVTDASGKAPNDYAGIYGHVIDGIQVKLVNKPGYHAEVRVQLTDRTGWLSWSSQYSTGADAYAGIYGIGIDRVQIRIVKN